MPATNPQTISGEIIDEIMAFLASGQQYGNDDHKLTALEHRAKQLARTDSRDGYIALAAISMLRGDFSEMKSRYVIATNQGLSAEQKLNHATTLAHAGFYTEAAAILNSIVDLVKNPGFAAAKAILCFQFQTAVKLVAKAEAMKLPPLNEIKDPLMGMSAITKKLGLDDAYLARLADCAGEVLRESKVFYKNLPAFNVSLVNEDGEFIVATYDVPVSCEKASEMTFSLAEKLFAQGMNVEHFGFRFRGAE